MFVERGAGFIANADPMCVFRFIHTCASTSNVQRVTKVSEVVLCIFFAGKLHGSSIFRNMSQAMTMNNE